MTKYLSEVSMERHGLLVTRHEASSVTRTLELLLAVGHDVGPFRNDRNGVVVRFGHALAHGFL